MKIKKFTPENTPSYQRKGTCSISIQRRGIISISVAASAILGIGVDDRVCLAQDENSPKDWFIAKDAEGFSLRKNTNADSFFITNKSMVEHFLKENSVSDRVKSIIYGMSKEENIDAGGYLILTRAPMKVTEL